MAPEHDAISPEHDAISPEHDAISPEHDAISPEHDARSPEHDAISPEHDARSPEHDALSPERDALSPVSDEHSPVFNERSPVFDACAAADGECRNETRRRRDAEEEEGKTPSIRHVFPAPRRPGVSKESVFLRLYAGLRHPLLVPVVVGAGVDAAGAVKLIEEDDEGEFVLEGEGTQRPAPVGGAAEFVAV